MKKLLQKLAAACALVLAIGLIPLAACTPEQSDETATYTVAVQCESNSAMWAGLNVQLESGGTVAAEKACTQSGVSFTLPKGEYTVHLVPKTGFETILDNYSYPLVKVDPENPDVTVVVTPLEDDVPKIAYNVTVTKPDGTPAAGIRVELCGGANGSYACHGAVTDANGVAAFELPAGNYDVHINAPGEGFTFNNDAYKMGETGGNLSVALLAA